MSARLSKTVVLGGLVYKAGTEISDEIADRITAKDVFASRLVSQTTPAGDDDGSATTDYSKSKVDELKAEIARRNEGRDDESKLSDEGKKDELVATLKADDERLAATADEA